MRQSKYYSFIFISIITIVCAGLLSFAAMALKPRQELNETVEMKKNILKAVGILNQQKKISQDEIINIFDNSIESMVVDYTGQKIELPEGITIDNVNPELEEQKTIDKQYLPVYLQKEHSKIVAYCLPIFGKGLWSTIYGYIALESDLNTIKGVTFYKQGETPGLGAEIAADWFTKNFNGKKIFDKNGNLTSVVIIKGVTEKTSPKFYHEVDGISGATKTCDGINIFILKDLTKYKNFLLSNRTNS